MKSVDARHNVRPARGRVKMEHASRITRVSVMLVGLEGYAIKISHGPKTENMTEKMTHGQRYILPHN